jgi:hypothetical protein
MVSISLSYDIQVGAYRIVLIEYSNCQELGPIVWASFNLEHTNSLTTLEEPAQNQLMIPVLT